MKHRKTIRHFDHANHAHELTFSCVHQLNLLTTDEIRGWLADAIEQARLKHSFSLWAYMFMPNHVHLLIMPRIIEYATQKILKSIKQPVGRKFINRTKGIGGSISRTNDVERAAKLGRFWQDGPGYDRNVFDLRTAFNMGNYIHNNPVRKKLVSNPEDWYWSSAPSWADLDEGPIRIDKDSMPER